MVLIFPADEISHTAHFQMEVRYLMILLRQGWYLGCNSVDTGVPRYPRHPVLARKKLVHQHTSLLPLARSTQKQVPQHWCRL